MSPVQTASESALLIALAELETLAQAVDTAVDDTTDLAVLEAASIRLRHLATSITDMRLRVSTRMQVKQWGYR